MLLALQATYICSSAASPAKVSFNYSFVALQLFLLRICVLSECHATDNIRVALPTRSTHYENSFLTNVECVEGVKFCFMLDECFRTSAGNNGVGKAGWRRVACLNVGDTSITSRT